MELQVPAIDSVEVSRSQAFARQQGQAEAKRRVLFVLQMVPDVLPTETIAKKDLSEKAESPTEAAPPAKPAQWKGPMTKSQ